MKIRVLHRRGFTLVELAVVLAISAILTLIAVGSYSNLRRSQAIRVGAEGVNRIFGTARSFAISTNGYYRVVFALDASPSAASQAKYWIDEIYGTSRSVPADPTPAMPDTPKRPKITTPHFLPTGLALTDMTVSDGTNSTVASPATAAYVIVRFFPDGSSDEATVHLEEEASDPTQQISYYTVRLFGATGKSKILAQVKQ